MSSILKFSLLAFVLISTGWWLGRYHDRSDPQHASMHSPDTRNARTKPDDLGLLVADDAARVSAQPLRPRAAPRRLPSLDQPLREVVDELRRGARDGDFAAACRLSRSLSSCSRPDSLNHLANESDDAIANRIARQTSTNPARTEALLQQRLALRADAHRWLEYCEGFSPAPAEQILRAQMRSAQLGDFDAMLGLAMAGPWGSGTALLQRPELAFAFRQSYRQAVRGVLQHDPMWTFVLLPQIGDEDLRLVVGDLVPEPLRDPRLARVFMRLALSPGQNAAQTNDDGTPFDPELVRRAENVLRDMASELGDFRARYQGAVGTLQRRLSEYSTFDQLRECDASSSVALLQAEA